MDQHEMSDLVLKLEDILKRYLEEAELSDLDLSDDDCIHRKFFFDRLPEEAAREALLLFPNGESLFQKYLEILSGFKEQKNISNEDLCSVVKNYLESSSTLMEEEDEEAIEFIKAYQQVKIADSMERFEPGRNLLHKHAYGAVSEFLLNELPDDDALWILYDWSLEKTKWVTVSAYFLEDFLAGASVPSGLFKPGFELWRTGNSNHYWAEGNSFSGRNVLCRASN
jgi:hypothetical protein